MHLGLAIMTFPISSFNYLELETGRPLAFYNCPIPGYASLKSNREQEKFYSQVMLSHTLELELLSYHHQEIYRGILLLPRAKTSKVPDVSPQLLAYLKSPCHDCSEDCQIGCQCQVRVKLFTDQMQTQHFSYSIPNIFIPCCLALLPLPFLHDLTKRSLGLMMDQCQWSLNSSCFFKLFLSERLCFWKRNSGCSFLES